MWLISECFPTSTWLYCDTNWSRIQMRLAHIIKWNTAHYKLTVIIYGIHYKQDWFVVHTLSTNLNATNYYKGSKLKDNFNEYLKYFKHIHVISEQLMPYMYKKDFAKSNFLKVYILKMPYNFNEYALNIQMINLESWAYLGAVNETDGGDEVVSVAGLSRVRVFRTGGSIVLHLLDVVLGNHHQLETVTGYKWWVNKVI